MCKKKLKKKISNKFIILYCEKKVTKILNIEMGALKQRWNECIDILKDIISKEELNIWFSSDVYPEKYEDGYLYLNVPTEYYAKHIDEYYSDKLILIIRRVYGNNTKLTYLAKVTNNGTITSQSKGLLPKNQPQMTPFKPMGHNIPNPFVIPGLKQIEIDSRLNPNYSFESFVEGTCNRFARSAGYAVAKNPGKTAFNPFLIFSKVGLGKTHLANAIGIETKRLNPDKTVLYVSADHFLRQFMQSARDHTIDDFLQFYLTMIDVLIIDDIQYLENKSGSQEVFFQIFNTLHSANKQIIITSDKAPSEMVGFEERVLSRLKWGLNAELLMPDTRTRMDIIKKKIERGDVAPLDDAVVEFLAYTVNTSVRELEGILVSLTAFAAYSKSDITIDVAREIANKFVKSNSREITVEYIQKTVCNYYNITVDQMLSRSRKSNIVAARHISMYLSRKLTGNSLVTIGDKCGKKDHATVLHACKSIENTCQTNEVFRKNVEEIEKRIVS